MDRSSIFTCHKIICALWQRIVLPCSIAFTVLLILCPDVLPADTGAETSAMKHLAKQGPQRKTFEASSTCSTCHQNIFRQFAVSMHARSFTNPLFKNMYFDILLKQYSQDETLAGEAQDCIACHSPVTYRETGGYVLKEELVNPDYSGVECDFCHRITGYKGDKPGSGNYIAEPGMLKFGPIPQKSNWHHAYAELQTKSEFCAICHNRINRYGLEIISTFSEWQESRYAKEGIQCQDCHMNVKGFLTAGKPIFERGYVSQNDLAKSTELRKLYTHRFPGAHSESQVNGAIKLDIQVNESDLVPGKETLITVNIDNTKSGHKLPTGTAELRFLYLDLYAQVGDKEITIPASSLSQGKFDVSGESKFDAEILGKEFPGDRRLYRAVCVNPSGKQTMYSYDAEKIIFDNRLEANEIRKEEFSFKVPDDIGPVLSLWATLYYLRYPDPFAEKLDVGRAKRIKLAAFRKYIGKETQPPDNGGQQD